MKSTKPKDPELNKTTRVKKTAGKIYKNGQFWDEAQLENAREYRNEYVKNTYRTYVFRLGYEKDANLIEFCNSQENLTALIKELLTEKMIEQDFVSKNMK